MSNTHPYSGATPIPKIGNFLEEQRRQVAESSDEHNQASRRQEQQPAAAAAAGTAAGRPDGQTEARKDGRTTNTNAHPSTREQLKQLKRGQGSGKGNRRTVKDPTTGNQVEIEDVNADFKEATENPELVVPKSALPNCTVNQRDFAGPTQSMEEYAEKQDVTAPPAPIRPGTTADIPIRGEKTNVSSPPTPIPLMANH